MRIPEWGAVTIALAMAGPGCAGDRFSTCDGCDDAGTTAGGSSGSGSGGTPGAGGSMATGGTAGRGGSSGSAGSGGSGGTRDGGSGAGGGGSGGSAGSAGSTGTGGTEGGEGFPRTGILDDFNRPDGLPGDNWVGNTSGFEVSAQRLARTSGGCEAILWQSLFGAEQEVFATIASVDPTAGEINLVLKAQELSNCELLEIMYSPSDQLLEMHYCSAGMWQEVPGISLTLQSGDKLGARFYANASVHVFVNGVRTMIFDASAYPHAGRGGRIGVNCDASGGSDIAWDDFGGG